MFDNEELKKFAEAFNEMHDNARAAVDQIDRQARWKLIFKIASGIATIVGVILAALSFIFK